MDGRILAIGVIEEALFPLSWIVVLSSLPTPFSSFSWWSVWGIALEGIFASVGLGLIVFGIVRQGRMSERWARALVVSSIVVGVYALFLTGQILSGSGENLSMCGFSVTQNRCDAGMAQVRLGWVFALNLFVLGATFLSSLGWVVNSRKGHLRSNLAQKPRQNYS